MASTATALKWGKQTEQERLLDEGHYLPKVMEHSELPNNDSEGSSSSDDQMSPAYTLPSTQTTFDEDTDGTLQFTPGSTISTFTPMTGQSTTFSSWNTNGIGRPRSGSSGALSTSFEKPSEQTMMDVRSQRPSGPARTPSNTYAPPRRPPHFASLHSNRQRSSSGMRVSRRDPNAQYRAQEKAYVQRVRNDPTGDWFNSQPHTPSVGYSTDSETDEEFPSSELHFDNDPYDPETQMFLGNDEMQPSIEEIQVPENRERLEWHAMLANVLKGDVVRQEKQRLIGSTVEQSKDVRNNEIWMAVRAKSCGRTLPIQRKLVEDGRGNLGPLIEEIISFEIKGETEAGKTAMQQVKDVVAKIEKCELLYSHRKELHKANPRAASDEFRASCDAIIAWHNITELINTELGILQGWVGNEELDFAKGRFRSSDAGDLTDESSFLDRILKEDGLKSLQGNHSMLIAVEEVINKAKGTLIENAEAFVQRHLPPYIEELLTLINFPSRLIQEIIRMRLSYAKKMKDTAPQSAMIIDQMIAHFQILLQLAVKIKHSYLIISQPEPGWDLPPCIDDNFDSTIVDALKFYFKMLNWKLGVNKNTFKEAEILEQEWDFSNKIGRQLENGDIEVAEQFSSLTAKSLLRLTNSFEKELERRPEESALEKERRYKSILDSVRVRQRKLLRFSGSLRERFENATEFSLNVRSEQLQDFYQALVMSGHFLVQTDYSSQKGVYLIASPSLIDRPKEIESILGTSFHADDAPEDPTNPYILVVRPENTLHWEGQKVQISMVELPTDLRPGRLRLVADGSEERLSNARLALNQVTGVELDVVIEQRANLSRVNAELGRIKKTAYKLSNTIMESVEIIRDQNREADSQDLIQSCFAFATEFGKRSLLYMDANRRMMNNLKLTRLALDWVSFICDDCDAADRKTFKWAVVALEFAMMMTRGTNILAISEEEYSTLRTKVAGCMSLLISHFDIMGARSTLAAQAEKQRIDAITGQLKKMDMTRMRDDEEAQRCVREQRLARLMEIEEQRIEEEAKRQALGRVLKGSTETDRSLTFLSSSATNVTMRWQQGNFVGGGTFGSVYAAINLDTGYLMAVKEIRLQDPQLIPTIAQQIRDEMAVLEVLDHPNIVSYYGIQVHRDKVYIFMEFCSGGSLAGLLEHGRIEDETVMMVYALQLLEGLAYLHQSQIIHRDIKPENILLDHNGVIKYVDFGAAKVIARQGKTIIDYPSQSSQPELPNAPGAPRKNQKTMTGTPMYMSPEVIRGDAGPAAGRHGSIDIWSLGCVILEMATGRRPWASLDNEWAIMYNIAQGNPPQLPTRDQLSDCGIDFLNRCFDRDPNRRASAAELLQHEWIMKIRQQVVSGGEPQTPSDAGSSGGSSSAPSRQNSSSFM